MSHIRKTVHPARAKDLIDDELRRLLPRVRMLRRARRQVKALCENPYFKLPPFENGFVQPEKETTVHRASRQGAGLRGERAGPSAHGDLPRAIRRILLDKGDWVHHFDLLRHLESEFDMRDVTVDGRRLRGSVSKRLYDMKRRGEIEAAKSGGSQRWRIRRESVGPEPMHMDPIFNVANF